MSTSRMWWKIPGLAGCSLLLMASLLRAMPGGDDRTDELPDLMAPRRQALVERICGEIGRVYPFEEIGRTTQEGILHLLRSGDYDDITSKEELAARLTADMESLSKDKHMDLIYDPVMAAEVRASQDAGATDSGPMPTEVENARWDNYGFKELRILEGQVGYLDLRMFFAARYAGPTAVAAMDFLGRCNAVILDLRLNGGGWEDMVTLLASYFVNLEDPEVLAISRSTLDGTYEASVLSAYVPGKRLTALPIYILISSSTASAAEAFTSTVKHLNKKVTLVGHTTAGAENPVGYVPVGDGFVLKIPCFKQIYGGGRSGWEGKGVEPDVEAPFDRTLETAHLQALRTLADQLTDKVARERLQWAMDGVRAAAEPATVSRSTLESYVGSYRGTRVSLEGDDLFVQFGDRPRRRLLAIAPDYFLVEGRDDVRLRFVSEQGRVIGVERLYSDGYRMLSLSK